MPADGLLGASLMLQGASPEAALAGVRAEFSKDEPPHLAPVYSKTQNTRQEPMEVMAQCWSQPSCCFKNLPASFIAERFTAHP